MTYHVIVDQHAIDDIERNARWWAEHHSAEQAVRWYESAFVKIYSLDAMPERHGLSYENGDFPYEIRDLLFGLGSRPRYRAVFTIKGNEVHVLTVRRAEEAPLTPGDLPLPPTDSQ